MTHDNIYWNKAIEKNLQRWHIGILEGFGVFITFSIYSNYTLIKISMHFIINLFVQKTSNFEEIWHTYLLILLNAVNESLHLGEKLPTWVLTLMLKQC